MMTYIVQLMRADDTSISDIIYVEAERLSWAHYKIDKYITENLEGRWCYRITRADMIERVR